MDHEREKERQTYQLCRLGFGFLAFALLVACFDSFLTLPRLFGGRAFLPWLLNSSLWHWIDAPIVWLSLIGSYLLWGRWDASSWQRRSGLLVLMGIVDGVLWLIKHGAALGLHPGDIDHHWLRENLGQALGWAEFALIASLSCEVMVHLGVEPATETGKATRSLAATGAGVWMLWFCQLTDWKNGWPLRPRPPHFIEALLLEVGWLMIATITLIQVTALTIAACRQCTNVLAEMDREDAVNDPLRPAWLKEGDEPEEF
jgi:hypothetical protein